MSKIPTLGHNDRFGLYEAPMDERMRAIRAAGFDDVMLHWETEGDNSPEERFDMALRAGLHVVTAHFQTETTPAAWTEGKAGDAYERTLIAALRACAERGIKHLVVHTTKKFITPPYNMTGVRRFRRAAEAAEQYQVNIALENTRFLNYNQYLYEHIPSERLRFCFDCGHANCFTPAQDPLALFGDKLVTMHLHDNHGAASGDEHMMPGEGNIDFAALMQRLSQYHPAAYNLESFYSPRDREEGLSMQEYLDRSYQVLSDMVGAVGA